MTVQLKDVPNGLNLQPMHEAKIEDCKGRKIHDCEDQARCIYHMVVKKRVHIETDYEPVLTGFPSFLVLRACKENYSDEVLGTCLDLKYFSLVHRVFRIISYTIVLVTKQNRLCPGVSSVSRMSPLRTPGKGSRFTVGRPGTFGTMMTESRFL